MTRPDPFQPRDAAVEYWFWKFHAGGLAFLLDLIVRRSAGTAEVRASVWVDGQGRVVHQTEREWSARPGRVAIGATELVPGASAGSADDVSWDLRWDPGSTLVTPLRGAMGRVEPFDTVVLTWPLSRFDGWVEVGGRRFDVHGVPGAFYHYWGRALSRRWVWISASSFEGEPDRRLEAIVSVRTRLFGGPLSPVTIGYLWTTDGERSDLTVSTVNGLVTSRPVPGGIAVDAIRLRGPRHRVIATWGEIVPNDIGEGIVQTMHGDLVVDGHRAVPGTVGLETRAWPSPAVVAAMRANR